MSTNKLYFAHLDALKGLSILLMVMGHALAWSYEDKSFLHQKCLYLNNNLLYSSLLYKVIYSFHMPLLFFISGYLFYKTKSIDNFMKTLKRRFQRIFIPYIITGSILFFLKDIYGYWFLMVLFIINILTLSQEYLISIYKFNKFKSLIFYITIYIILIILSKVNLGEFNNILYLNRLANFYPAFAVGIFIKKYNINIINEKLSCIALLTYIISFCLNEFVSFSGIFYHLIKCTIYLSSTFFLYNAFYKLNFKVTNPLINIGKHSLEIYILHIYFTISFYQMGSFIISIDDIATNLTCQITYSFIISLISIFLSIIIGKLLNSNTILSKFLFGH